jgi:outer membrane protein TolC
MRRINMKKRILILMMIVVLVAAFPIYANDLQTVPLTVATTTEITLPEESATPMTLEEAQTLAIENSYAISNLNRRILDTKDMISNQRDLQTTMSDLLKLPLQFIPSDITNDYVNALMIKKGYGVKGAQVQLTVLENTLDQTKEALRIGAASAYYNVLLAQKTVEMNNALYENAQGHLRTAKVRFENGVITRLELLKAEMAVNSAKTDLFNAEDDLRIKNLEFNNTIGLSLDQEVILISAVEWIEMPDMSLEEAIDISLETRPEIENKRAEFELKEIEVSAITSYYTPNLRQHKFALEELEEAEHYYKQTFRDIELDVRSKYFDLVKSERAINNINETIGLSKEALRVTKLLYEYDLATLQDVSDAEVALTQSEIGKYQMLIGYNLTRMLFDNSIGFGLPKY